MSQLFHSRVHNDRPYVCTPQRYLDIHVYHDAIHNSQALEPAYASVSSWRGRLWMCNGVSFSPEGWKHVISKEMDRTGGHPVQWCKLDSGRYHKHAFSYTQSKFKNKRHHFSAFRLRLDVKIRHRKVKGGMLERRDGSESMLGMRMTKACYKHMVSSKIKMVLYRFH